MTEIPGFYPVHIRESRYSGTYSGGRWVLMAGCYSPEETDAFGGDIPCADFWLRVEEEGPVIEIEGPHGTEEVYVASGGNPSKLIGNARWHIIEHSTFTYKCLNCGETFESESFTDAACPECVSSVPMTRRDTIYNGE